MYAPVSTLSLREENGLLVGFAAPAAGPTPCLLELSGNDIPVSVARATRFSREALEKSIRLGWCGVVVPGLAMAAALGNRLRVRCGVSGRIVWEEERDAPIPAPRPHQPPLTVFEILALSRAEDEAASLEEIEPILRWHLANRGAASFVGATYESFLGRPAEQNAIDDLSPKPFDELTGPFVRNILNSPEYHGRKVGYLPGPFNHAFHYDLQALDA